jgi:hypothetical protein
MEAGLAKARQALVLAALGVTWAATAANAAVPALAGSTTSYFSATTTASAIHVSFAQSPADSIITGSLINDAAGYATSGFDSGGSSEATAAPLYPGTLVVGGPGLLCTDLFTCPFTPPPYPLLADASYPQTPTAHIVTTKPTVGLGTVLSLTPSTATAQAHVGGNASATKTGAVSLLGGTPLALSVGSSAASTRVRTHGSVITIDVRSSVSHIKVGQLLRIASLRTTDSITLGRGRAPVDRPRVAISGVTVAGKSATITSTGIHLAGHHLASLARTLIRSGVKVRTLGIARTDHANSARSSAGGIEIDFAVPVTKSPYIANPLTGVPGLNQVPGIDLKGTYVGVVQLGGAGAAGTVQAQRDSGVPPPASTSGRSSSGTTSRGSSGVAAGAGQVTTPPLTAASPVVAADPQPGRSLLLVALSRVDLMTLYLVLAIGTAAIFLGWRGSAALRRRSGMTGRRR